MTNVYFSKADFLKDLAQFSKKIDVDASNKLPSFCLQDKEGVQYPATKPVIMYHLVNAIEDANIINRNKSCTYKRKFMSVCWTEKLEAPVVEDIVIEIPKVEAPVIEAPKEEIKKVVVETPEVVAPKSRAKKTTPKKK